VKIRNFTHKGLKRLYEEDNPKGVPSACVDKFRNIFAFMDAMEDGDELRSIPTWKAHLLAGGRRGTWSLHVTKNWRMTFWIDAREKEIGDVSCEDYHYEKENPLCLC
jgi:toxin HigB-1